MPLIACGSLGSVQQDVYISGESKGRQTHGRAMAAQSPEVQPLLTLAQRELQ